MGVKEHKETASKQKTNKKKQKQIKNNVFVSLVLFFGNITAYHLSTDRNWFIIWPLVFLHLFSKLGISVLSLFSVL